VIQQVKLPKELGVFDDPDFCALLHFTSRASLSWQEFLKRPLPRNLSPISTWHYLYAIRKCMAVNTGLIYEGCSGLWYSVTLELVALINDITRRCTPGSVFYDALFSKDARHILRDFSIQEVVAALKIEGMDLDTATLQRVADVHLAVPSAVYQLADNLLCLLEGLEDYESQGFSLSLFDRVTMALLDGVDGDELKAQHARPHYQAGIADSDETKKLLSMLMRYAEHECGEKEDYPLLRGMLIADSLRFCRPFGELTSAISSVLMRLYYRSQGFDLLALLPLSRQTCGWMTGDLKYPGLVCDVNEYAETTRYSPDDLSIHQTLSAQMIAGLLDELTVRLQKERDQKRFVRDKLHGLTTLNNRQRSVLARAIRQPFAEFRIQYHRARHHIAYATARQDLLDLVDLGYLRIERQGKAFVFLPGTHLIELKDC
jgi:hypothetical protein